MGWGVCLVSVHRVIMCLSDLMSLRLHHAVLSEEISLFDCLVHWFCLCHKQLPQLFLSEKQFAVPQTQALLSVWSWNHKYLVPSAAVSLIPGFLWGPDLKKIKICLDYINLKKKSKFLWPKCCNSSLSFIFYAMCNDQWIMESLFKLQSPWFSTCQ